MAEKNYAVLTSGPMLAVACFAAYWLSFRVNALVSPWLEYAPGASLLFLPAGVKLVALLVAGPWGLLGLAAGALMMAADVWTAADAYALLGNTVVWLGVPFLLIEWLLRVYGVERNLINLTFPRLLQIAIIVTIVGSFSSSAYAVFAHGRPATDCVSTAMAMAFGDFLGVGVMLVLMMATITLLQRRGVRQR